MPKEDEKRRFLSAHDDEKTWLRILEESERILDEEDIPHLAIGSIATTAMGYDEECSDIDLVVPEGDAGRALKAFERHGFETEKSEPDWIYKAVKDSVLVDVIFAVGDGNQILADEEMFRRGRTTEIKGRPVRVVSSEDFLVMQAISNKQEAPDYWYKGLKAVANAGLDWSYVLKRAAVGPERVLSLLIYARSDGLDVPDEVLDELYGSLR